MSNFFLDNEDVVFHFNKFNLEKTTEIMENNYEESKLYDYAPANFEDAKDNYRRVLELVGDIAANRIAPRAMSVDEEGAQLIDGKVHYAKGTQENLKDLSQADVMGMILPRRVGGLNFPLSVYMMATEMVSQADASLMNIFGLQDIADSIRKFGTEDQCMEFLPKFSTGEYTGAMALTEPDAGSDLQACKLQAYQDEKGNWFLRGVKRFITNGNAEVLLVLARSEAGTKDGRGLSYFACYGDKTVVVRRIENKHGIHGSPTCELQFNDTPCQLVGQRKYGLIKYTLDLMYRARLGVSSQAVGVSQAAYLEALKYAKEREQFGKTLYEMPVIANMLIDMRVALEASRTLLYNATDIVGYKEALEEKLEHLKKEGKPVTEINAEIKNITKIANLVTPLAKYVATENCNQITYDAMQIHGGTGYMKEFHIEQLARDGRITNIYEGTSQLQVIAAFGGVLNDVMKDLFEEKETKEYKGGLSRLANILKEIRVIYFDSLKYVLDKKDTTFQDVAAKDLVELYSYLYIGYLLIDDAEVEPRKAFIANRYIIQSLASARKNAESIKNELFSDILHADKILI